MTLKERVQTFLAKNPINDNIPNKYKHVCTALNISVKQASRYWLELKQKIDNTHKPCNLSEAQATKILKQEGENLNISIKVDFEIKSLNDLLEACEVDPKKWEVISWECKKWDLGIKNQQQEIETKALFSVNAKFKAITIDTNLNLQKDVILKELLNNKNNFDSLENWYNFTQNIDKAIVNKRSNLLELALFDLHFGKLAHKEEAGEDYDIKIAVDRYNKAIETLLSRVDLNTVEKILLPVGQDLLNVDNLHGTTTAGTPQDNDSRFYKVVRTVKNVLIETINKLSLIAPVDVVIVVGNHDEQSTFMIGEMLDAYYYNNRYVNIYNSASLRKYYKYGISGIMFTHGNREKFNELGMIFAAENPKLWADTKQRFVQIGHFHHNKKANTLTTQEFQGFQVQIIPSLSGSDYWHKGKGFLSLKQGKAFLYDKEQGLIAEYTYTV